MNEIAQDPQYKYTRTPLSGTAQQEAIHKKLLFRQAGEYYRGLSSQNKDDLITALAGDLGQVTNEHNKYAMLSYFYKADADYGTRLAQAVHANVQQVQSLAAKLSEN
jgi:catalase